MTLYIFIFFFFFFLGGAASIFTEYGHCYGPLQSLLLFIEMPVISSTSDMNSDANTFSHAATVTWEELSANICKTALLSSFNCSLKFFSGVMNQ